MVGGEDEEPESPVESGPERTRAWVVDQMAGVCMLEATSEASLHSAVHFLTIHAFFKLDASAVGIFDPQAVLGKLSFGCLPNCQKINLSRSRSDETGHFES